MNMPRFFYPMPEVSPPSFIPHNEQRFCLECEAVFSYRAQIRVKGEWQCPACTSTYIYPLALLLDGGRKWRWVHSEKPRPSGDGQAEKIRGGDGVRARMVVEDNFPYFMTSIIEPQAKK
jgi:hypothetical protein